MRRKKDYFKWLQVNEAIDKTDCVVFRCRLRGVRFGSLAGGAGLDVRPRRAHQVTLSTNPFVDMAALSAGLLTDVLKADSTSSNAPLSSASRGISTSARPAPRQRPVMISDKIGPHHLERKTLLYV